MGSRDMLMGARAERRKAFVGGLEYGGQEHPHKGIKILPHHNPSSSSSSSSSSPSSISSSSFCCWYDGGVSSSNNTGSPVFCASNNHTFTPPFNNMFYHVGPSGAALSTDPFSTLSSSVVTGLTSMDKKTGTFSASQLQEFERQRSIYGYMMASAPVPTELLVTNSINPSITNPYGFASSASNSNDMEPWRCRRTDGKKWRCSRNALPDHKYCERHSHKNRGRSRKPVELPAPTVNHSSFTIATAAKTDTDQFARTYIQNPNFYGQSGTQFAMYPSMASASTSYDQHRDLGWFMKEDEASVISSSNHGLREMIQLKVGSDQETLRSNVNNLGFDCDLNFGQKDELVTQSFGSLEDLMSLNQTQALETRHFIDAFANEATGDALTLSMAGEIEHSRNEAVDPLMCANHQWMSHEGLSWLSSPPGGPLAEALCLGSSSNASSCSINSTTTSSCSRSSS